MGDQTITPGSVRPRILCVDDETRVLEALERTLRNRFTVVTAIGAEAALAELERDPAFAVIMSDLRMPGMDGVSLLARAQELAPEATRVLLTGHVDLEVAIEAVNHGRVYQFLRKPCHPEVMARALQLASEQHRLVTAQREVLEQTLRGSIRALADVLALVSPAAFGRSERVQRMAGLMARQFSVPDPWSIEVAATIWHLGCMAVSPSLADRVGRGAELEPEELAMVAQLPETALRLVAHIPRLDSVRELLNAVAMPPNSAVPLGAQVFRAALEMDTLEARGLTGAAACEVLDVVLAGYGPRIMETLRGLRGVEDAAVVEVRAMRLCDVTLGMVFADDVTNQAGLLLVARGQEVTTPLLERVRTYWYGFAYTAMVQMVLPASQHENVADASDDQAPSMAAGDLADAPTVVAAPARDTRGGSDLGRSPAPAAAAVPSVGRFGRWL